MEWYRGVLRERSMPSFGHKPADDVDDAMIGLTIMLKENPRTYLARNFKVMNRNLQHQCHICKSVYIKMNVYFIVLYALLSQ